MWHERGILRYQTKFGNFIWNRRMRKALRSANTVEVREILGVTSDVCNLDVRAHYAKRGGVNEISLVVVAGKTIDTISVLSKSDLVGVYWFTYLGEEGSDRVFLRSFCSVTKEVYWSLLTSGFVTQPRGRHVLRFVEKVKPFCAIENSVLVNLTKVDRLEGLILLNKLSLSPIGVNIYANDQL